MVYLVSGSSPYENVRLHLKEISNQIVAVVTPKEISNQIVALVTPTTFVPLLPHDILQAGHVFRSLSL